MVRREKCVLEVEARLAPHPAPARFCARGCQGRAKGRRPCSRLRNGFGIHAFELSAADRSYSSDSRAFAALRLSIVGDSLYGAPLLLVQAQAGIPLEAGREERALIGRVALHAGQLTWPIRNSGAMIAVAAPWPGDMMVAVKSCAAMPAAVETPRRVSGGASSMISRTPVTWPPPDTGAGKLGLCAAGVGENVRARAKPES